MKACEASQDQAFVPLTGRTQRGLPVSWSAAPGQDLANSVSRFSVFAADQPERRTAESFLLMATAALVVLARGEWEAEVAPGRWQAYHGAILFGPQSRRFNVRGTGSLALAAAALAPAGWPALFDEPASGYVDGLFQLSDLWGDLPAAFDRAAALVDEPAAAASAIAEGLRQRLAGRTARYEPAAHRLELFARHDPTRPVSDIADQMGLTPKQLRAVSERHFGLAPKAVLRRARFLDLAAALQGFGQASDEELPALRFYDQAHLNREVRHFVDMTPAQFRRTPTPFLTFTLEARQLQRAEEASLLEPGMKPPWRV